VSRPMLVQLITRSAITPIQPSPIEGEGFIIKPSVQPSHRSLVD
jgi:hypothetical protein